MTYHKSDLTAKIDLILDALMHLNAPNFSADALTETEHAQRGIFVHDYGIETWDWPQGVGLYGLEKLQSYYNDTRYDDFLSHWFARNIAEGLPSRNINTTAPYLALEGLAHRRKNKELIDLCSHHAQWLMHDCPRTKSGGLQHITTGDTGKYSITLNPGQLWIDTLFMAVLFLARAGKLHNQSEWTNEAIVQILLHIQYLRSNSTGLFYHGWSFERQDNFGGVFWCRGNSWFAYGALELLELIETDIDKGTLYYIQETFKSQIEALCSLQAESGLWHTVLNDKESREEVSGSAAICAAIFKGIRLGLLSTDSLPAAQKALSATIDNIGANGIVQNVSIGTDVGLDSTYYKSIKTAPMGYGQSMAAFALTEALLF